MNKEKLKQHFPNLEEGLYDEILENATQKDSKAGETLMRVSQTIRSALLITDGTVKLYREDDDGNEFFIYQLNPGQAYSLSMVCAAKHETSEVLAKALTDSVAISIPVEHKDKWWLKDDDTSNATWLFE